MDYQETLSWMFNRLPMFQNQGRKALNHKLDNIQALTSVLNHPEKKFKSLHIAGTNGKGSSSHMLASVLQQAGYKVGLYTSPHLKDFRERIKINGIEIPENKVIAFIEKYKPFFEENHLSFFEMTVGLAFDYFAEEQVDIAVIEVGLGGRFDSTNVINPEVSLITNISKDHIDILGNTLPEIAVEKAGIIKKNTPIVISEYNEETAPVFIEKAKKENAPIVFASSISTDLKTDLEGIYQEKNIKGVVAVLNFLRNDFWEISDDDIKAGLLNVVKNTGLKGRWQTLCEKPKIVCDTGHNEAGLSYVIKQISQQSFEKLHIVLGFAKDKDVEAALDMFPKDATYYFCKPNIPRGLDVHILTEIATKKGINGKAYDSVKQALQAAKENANSEDFIFVGGSTFVVAEIV
ncbi:tetrahydrofolate synthase [Capnocytophaga stomatis]|uniref:bifunctional folylpolyglutamate synthase/dihydrofolate synthase n=1 Tax=Capnocytophaga stomatis TaxID=1848904 RepID=UPI001950A0F1|nr:folylpolyglutamate synthase/dihydrofolate synthase family protein [Capnocytophaga stomatis]GIJ95444.1 tetrahydrofolate synthase [Capnocytophaga stomatis]